MTEDKPLRGQVALVTGASSGIGQACAIALAEAGAHVAINYRSDEEGARETIRRVEALGQHCTATDVQADVSKEEDVDRLFAEAAERLGPIDIVVSNAGVQRDAAFAEMSLDDWNMVIGVNLTGSFLCGRAAVRHFQQRSDQGSSRARGKLIFMSSVHDMIPWAGHANYAAAKGGLDMLMRSIAQEVAPQGIRVMAVSPGAIKTDINREAWDDPESQDKLLRLIPYGRIGEAEDVGRAVAWLASDAADYVHGTTLYVDGGMMLYPGFVGNG